MPRYKTADFEKGIANSFGIKSVICNRVGCDFKTLQKWLAKSKPLQSLYENERQKIVGMAESKLLDLIRGGDYRAVVFALTHLAPKEYEPPTLKVKVQDWRDHLPEGVTVDDAEAAQRQFAALLQGAPQKKKAEK